MSAASILVTGHFHHGRLESTGAGKWWLQVPSMDSGSDWFRHRKGESSASGMVTLRLTPGQGVGWDGLKIHTWPGDA